MPFDPPTRRSTLIVGLAVLALPSSPAFAQASAPVRPDISQSQWRALTLMVGTYARATSLLAQTRASMPRIREFATFESDEQATLAQVLTDSVNPTPVALDAAHQSRLNALQATPPGTAFDVAYVAGQIQGHHEQERIQQSFLNSIPDGANARHIAILARWSIQQHLAMLADIQGLMPA